MLHDNAFKKLNIELIKVCLSKDNTWFITKTTKMIKTTQLHLYKL